VIAVLADVHANLAALEAVLAEIERHDVSSILCLGDLVGYHPDANECTTLLMERGATCVAGNHDLACLGHMDSTPPLTGHVASNVQEWTARRLRPEVRTFLEGLPARRDLGWALAVHGCLINPRHVTGYITGTTAAWNLDWLAHTDPSRGVAFFGHTHVPAVYGTNFEWAAAEGRVDLSQRGPLLVNPGAVGQPRDGDPRAAFALFEPDDWSLVVVRVPYDVQRTVDRLAAEGFDPSLARRLEEGR